MSWLNSIERKYKYTCEGCEKSFIHVSSESFDICKEPRTCVCGGVANYSGFEPTPLNLRGKVAFDQNGRKGYAITDGRGNVRYVSATKEHYNNTGDIKPQYTKAYADHLRKVGQEDQLVEQKYDDLIKDRQHTVERMKTVKEARESMIKEDSCEI